MTLETVTPVFRVSDYQRAKSFWMEKLKFACTEEAGEPVTGFGIFRRDKVRIFLIAWNGPEAAYDNWRAYFHVSDFDALAAELASANVLTSGPKLTEYGMREVEVTDPDGNVVCFGSDP
ncbi:MAG: VOC family protein [Pseudomonadota bacterium]